jgi:hypothetical protein
MLSTDQVEANASRMRKWARDRPDFPDETTDG